MLSGRILVMNLEYLALISERHEAKMDQCRDRGVSSRSELDDGFSYKMACYPTLELHQHLLLQESFSLQKTPSLNSQAITMK